MKPVYFLRNAKIRQYLIDYIMSLELSETNPFVVKVQEMQRNLDQNALMWALLDCFEKQKQWVVNGALCWLESEEWKDLLSAAYKQETQRLAQGLNGGVVMLGMRTSKMRKKQFAEFIEFIYATGAYYDIDFSRSGSAKPRQELYAI